MKKYIHKLSIYSIAIITIIISSCSKEDVEEINNGTDFTVNGVKIGNIFSNPWSCDENDDYQAFALMYNYGKGDTKIFSWNLYMYYSELKPGVDVTDNMDIILFETDPLMLESYSFDITGGTVKVDSVNKVSITFRFNNLKFVRSSKDKEETFVLNGIITYHI